MLQKRYPYCLPFWEKKNPIPRVGTALNTPRGTLWDFLAFTARARWLLGGLLPRHSTDWQRGVNATVTGSGMRCVYSPQGSAGILGYRTSGDPFSSTRACAGGDSVLAEYVFTHLNNFPALSLFKPKKLTIGKLHYKY